MSTIVGDGLLTAAEVHKLLAKKFSVEYPEGYLRQAPGF